MPQGGTLQAVVDIDGRVNIARLRAACVALIARLDVLRTAVAAPVAVCDLAAASGDAQRQLRRRAARELRRSSLVSFVIMPSTDAMRYLVMTATSHVADARTFEICAGEIVRAASGVEARGDDALTYADVRAWQAELLAEEDAAAARRYWTSQAADAAATAMAPTILPFERVTSSPHPLAMCDVRLDATRIGRATAAFWLSAWQAFLGRASDHALSCVGVTLDGRTYGELTHVVGPLDRTVPVRWIARPSDTVAETVAVMDRLLREHAGWLEYAVPSQETPWAVGFAYLRWSPQQAGPLIARIDDATVDTTGAPLALIVHDHAEAHLPAQLHAQLPLQLHGDPRRFDAATVRRMGDWLLTMTEAAAANPTARWDELPWLTPSARAQIVDAWNDTHVCWPSPSERTLVDWIGLQADRTPDAIAVSTEDEAWSCAHVQAEANRLARRLQDLGAGAETRVGIWLRRSPQLVIALLGVLKAGAAYVPFDPDYPAARLIAQLADARVRVVLTETACVHAVPAGQHAVEVLDAEDAAWRQASPAPLTVRIDPAQLAYVIYTSGSTGTPKGVMNAHDGVLNGLRCAERLLGLTPDDRVLQKTTIGFDVSVWELFGALGTGATMVLARPGGQQDPVYLADMIARTGVTVAQFVPAMLDAFLTAGGLTGPTPLRLIANCGEALPGALVARAHQAWPGRLVNLYGPTEAAVEITARTCDPVVDACAGIVPIGRPFANATTYIVDRAGVPVPVGVIGMLLLGGVQVGRGYWARPDGTASRFVPDPFGREPGARLYVTGDLARYRADGVIEYVGRADSQVKLAGHRIELGEIAAVLRRQPHVRDAVVVLRDARLIAYIVPPLDLDTLKQALRRQLPDAWIPATIVPLDAWPLLPNGKIDRRRLPDVGAVALPAATYVEPRTELERSLATIWAEALRVDRVGIHDNFFALGGDSILSLQIVARAIRAGWRLTPRQVFEHPTVEQLATLMAPAESAESAPAAAASFEWSGLDEDERARISRLVAAAETDR